ncbi:MAG: hypothetical protein U0183_11745 [Polyangiaceae bacterium]
MSTDEAEIWVVRDEITSPPSRAVSLRKLRRGVKLGKLRLEYEVARVGTDRWMTLAELFDSRKPKPVVLTESSVVTSAPNRATSEEEAARVLERPHRPRLRRISKASNAPPSEPEPLELTADDVLSDPDLDVDDDEIDVVATSQLPKVIVDGLEDPLPLLTASPDATPTPAAPEALGDPTPLLAAAAFEPEPEPETARPKVSVPALAPPDTPASVFSSPPPSVRAAAPTLYTREESGGVTVTAIDVPFFALVRLMIKVAFASLPALVLLSVVLSLVLFGARWVAVAAGLGAR